MSNNKKILIITSSYPPIGGGGVQRVLKFSKYLSKMDWDVNVLTVKKDNNKPQDQTLLNDIPKKVKIYRSINYTPYNLLKHKSRAQIQSSAVKNKKNKTSFLFIINKLLAFILFPDREIFWLPWAYIKGKKIIKRNNINYIFTSYPSATNFFLSYLLAKNSKLPLIIDFRDEWCNNPLLKFPTILHKKLAHLLEKKIVLYAKKVVTASTTITNNYKAKYNENKFYTIMNGYDEDDFINFKKYCPEKFTITYTGTIYTQQSPTIFFQALDNLLKNNRIDIEHFKINIVGQISNDNSNLIPKSLIKITNIVGLVSHIESIKYLEKSSILLLYISNKRGIGCLTGKIFEYLRSKKPILAVIPPNGEAAKIIKNTRTGIIADPDDQRQIENAILGMYNDWKSDKLIYNCIESEIQKFDRNIQTKELSNHMLQLLD